MLNEDVKKYAALKAQADEIKSQMEELKESIVTQMGSEKQFTADDGTVVKLVEKETFKYVDEPAMIQYLKDHGMTSYIVEKISTSPLNKELKKGQSLTESLKSWYNKTVSTTLNVEQGE